MRSITAVVCTLLFPSLFLTTLAAQKHTPTSAEPLNVLTYHNDNGRTGLMPLETILTTANVNSTTFGKVNFLATDGKVDAEPLYASDVVVSGVTHNVLYVVTEHDSIYAFDADTGTQYWKASALLAGENPSEAVNNCGQISPQIGIPNTPVIDRNRNAIYFVAMSKDANSAYHQRLHALDLGSGAELFSGPTEIQAKYPGNGDNHQNGFVVFDPKQYAERTGLLEISGNIYMAFTSHCDIRPYTGWMMQYSASTLQQLSVLNFTPNGYGGAIWQAGAGLAADTDGYIYFLDGNGIFDTTLDGNGFPINGDYGNGMVKVSSSVPISVADYFNMYNTVQESNSDTDLGSGGALVLPDLSVTLGRKVHLVIGAGKDGNVYIASRDNMGKWNPNNNNNLYQQLSNVLPSGAWSMPAYFFNTVYFGGVNDHIKAFPIVNGKLATSPSSQSSQTFTYPGSTPSISANFSQSGILWAIENTSPAVLHAYNALNLTQELYNSNQQGSRDQFGPGNKFITPMIANGRVYVGTQTGVAVFGLLQ